MKFREPKALNDSLLGRREASVSQDGCARLTVEVFFRAPDLYASVGQSGVPRTINFQRLEFELAAFTVTVAPVRKHVDAMATPDPLVEKQLCDENPAGIDAVQLVLADIVHVPVSTNGT